MVRSARQPASGNSSADLREALPSIQPGRVSVVPVDLERVVSTQLDVSRSNVRRNCFDIESANACQLIDTAGAGAFPAQRLKRDPLNGAVVPADLEHAL